MPDGSYRATVHAGSVIAAANNALAADFTFDFFALSADADHNGPVEVDTLDFNLLASNFGKTLDVPPAPYPPRNPPRLIRNRARRRNLLMIF